MKAVRAILGNEDVNTKCDPGRSRKKQKKKLPPEKAGENRVKNQMPNQSIPGATTDAKPLKRSRKCEGSRLEVDEQLSQHQLSTKGLSVPSKADEAEDEVGS